MALEKIEAPYAGIDSQTAPAYIDKGSAEDSINLLPGFRGKAPVRGSLWYSHRLAGTNVSAGRVWTSAQGALVNQGTLNAVLVSSDLQASVAIADGPYSMSSRFVNVGQYVYGLSSTTQLEAIMHRWNGVVTSPGYAFVSYAANTPNGNLIDGGYDYVGIAHWQQRLFLLEATTPIGGSRHAVETGGVGGTVQAVPALTLRWTDAFDPADVLPAALSAWQDDVSGLTNEIVFDVGTSPLKPVDLAIIGPSLAVLCDDRIIMIRGSSPSNWVVRTDINRGAISESAHAQHNDALIFVSYDGCYLYDGAQLVDLSENVKERFQPGTYSKARVLKLDADYALVTLLDSATPIWSGILHVPTRTWTEFLVDTTITDEGYPWETVRSPWGPLVFGYRNIGATDVTRVWSADGLTRPSSGHGRDGYRAISDADSDPNTYVPIVAETTSRSVRLAQPISKAVIRRFVADYVQEGTAEAGRGWQFDIVDPTETTVLHTEDEADTADSTSDKRHRHVAEVYAEADEVKIKSTFTGNSSSDLRGELHDTYLEFDPAQRGSSF